MPASAGDFNVSAEAADHDLAHAVTASRAMD
jgi:hypothetical protein